MIARLAMMAVGLIDLDRVSKAEGAALLRLLPGQYFLGINLDCGRGFENYIPEAVQFEIISSPDAAEINAENFGGVVVPSATVSIVD